MSKRIPGILSLVILYLIAATFPAHAQSANAKEILQEAAKAMGGTQALRSLKNQVVESEGKQFDHTSTRRPGEPSQQVAASRSTLTRDLAQMRRRLEWDTRTSYPWDATVRWVEVIDGSVGLLQEGGPGAAAKLSRLHPARLPTRLREEKRAAARIVLAALGQKF